MPANNTSRAGGTGSYLEESLHLGIVHGAFDLRLPRSLPKTLARILLAEGDGGSGGSRLLVVGILEYTCDDDVPMMRSPLLIGPEDRLDPTH